VRIASFSGQRIGVITGDSIVDVSDLLGDQRGTWPPLDMVRFIAAYARDLESVRARSERGEPVPLASVHLETPVQWPHKLIAYPANYAEHITEMASKNRADINGFFLKAPSSLAGPGDAIVLPAIPGAEIHHECEVAIIIGTGGRHIPESEALDHVFGYSCLLDMTIRGRQERVMRKSYDTFTPVGPWITTADEIADPGQLDMWLTVNGQLRQQANTRDLILGMQQMISLASTVMTLHPGDIIATGTCSGVGPVADGDLVSIHVPAVGSMDIPVRQGSGGFNVAFQSSADKSTQAIGRT
jgi:2-keto-4-pentenoate hydratase/2-oxohepta-3-ene-1,7-dioic acid hydratase in catechol pathway